MALRLRLPTLVALSALLLPLAPACSAPGSSSQAAGEPSTPQVATGAAASDSDRAQRSGDRPVSAIDVVADLQVRGLQLTLLANEGFALHSAETTVVIDAFVTEPYSQYDALTETAADALRAGTAPFDDVTLALVSHVHRDHMQPGPTRAFLAASPDTQLVSSPEVVAAIEADGDVDGAQLHPLLPPPGKLLNVSRRGVSVDLLLLPHGNERFASIQNLGHLIAIGGVRVLHVGDADIVPATFAEYGLPDRGIDVALVPYWYFLDPVGRSVIAEHLAAPTLIACHLPAGERADFGRAVASSFPELIIAGERMQRWHVEPGQRAVALEPAPAANDER